MRVCKQMLISSSYHTYYTIARLQHLLRALGREGEETERVPDGAPREQIDEGETRRVVGGGDEGSLLRASVTGGEVRLTVLGRQTDALDLRALVRQEDESAERQRRGVRGADRDVHVVERARGDAGTALRRARLLSHAATSQKTHAFRQSLSFYPSHVASFLFAFPRVPRARARSALASRVSSRLSPHVGHHRTQTRSPRASPPPRTHPRHPLTRARFRLPHDVARRSNHSNHHPSSRVSLHRASIVIVLILIVDAPLERGDGTRGNGRAREHDSRDSRAIESRCAARVVRRRLPDRAASTQKRRDTPVIDRESLAF